MNIVQSLLHDALISTGHVQHCCLIKRSDMGVRAASVGYHVCLCPTYFKTYLLKSLEAQYAILILF